MDKRGAAKLVIELNRDATCDSYYYHNVVLYNRVIWQVRPGVGATIAIIPKEMADGA